METKRKPYQGVINIVRFNWHLYLIAFLVLLLLLFIQNNISEPARILFLSISIASVVLIIISLAVSYYVYDYSDLYSLNWIPNLDNKKVMNIHAGFDESSQTIKEKFSNTELIICDFYDEKKHKEISIKRARKVYPPSKDTIKVITNKIPFDDNVFDYCLVILSAHEIRDQSERINFFIELGRITKPNGYILVTEHLRDSANFIAFSFGLFHFYSNSTWKKTFNLANLKLEDEEKINPFIKTFMLKKNGDAH